MLLKSGFIVALLLLSVNARTEQAWHYTLGSERRGQQAQFCANETELLKLAAIFRDKGAESGYFAMRQLFDCYIAVQSFTPVEVLTSAWIKTETTKAYPVHFVRVETAAGDIGYLVTTREVRAKP